MTTPSEELAELVVNRLIEEGLLPQNKADVLIEKVASGYMSSDDWKLSVDLATQSDEDENEQ